jgi:hypothetical protein
MKIKISLCVLILCLSLLVQAAKPKTGDNLLGYWKLVKAETNGQPNPSMMMDRTFKFDKEGNFEGKVFINGVEKPYNSGMFFLPNDSTMITLHTDAPGGKLSRLAFTYNYHVKNDSLHLYGVYFTNTQEKSLLRMNFINEWWVKPPVLGK